jgi:hypothetical protein
VDCTRCTHTALASCIGQGALTKQWTTQTATRERRGSPRAWHDAAQGGREKRGAGEWRTKHMRSFLVSYQRGPLRAHLGIQYDEVLSLVGRSSQNSPCIPSSGRRFSWSSGVSRTAGSHLRSCLAITDANVTTPGRPRTIITVYASTCPTQICEISPLCSSLVCTVQAPSPSPLPSVVFLRNIIHSIGRCRHESASQPMSPQTHNRREVPDSSRSLI